MSAMHYGSRASSRIDRHPLAAEGRHVLGRVLATLRRWRRRTQDRAQLAALDDRMLVDIGLTRADADYLANKPFWKE